MFRTLLVASVGVLITSRAVAAKKVEGDGFSVDMDKMGAVNSWYHPKNQWEHEYFSDTKRYTYEQGVALCESMDAHVTSIASFEEANLVLHTMQNNRHGFWVGTTRNDGAIGVKSPGFGFEYFDDQTEVTWSNWNSANGEPSSDRNHAGIWNEPCVVQGYNNGNPLKWNDVRCDIRRRVICKRVYNECAEQPDDSKCAQWLNTGGVAWNKWKPGTAPNGDVSPIQANCQAGGLYQALDMESYVHAANTAGLSYTGQYFVDRCPVHCNSCRTTTTTLQPSTVTTFQTTTTSLEPTTTTSLEPTTTTSLEPTTTTTFQTTTTTFQTTTTTFQTTTTTFQTTTTTFQTTTTTFQTTSTTQSSAATTTFQTTSTSVEPTTAYQGPCGSRGWSDVEDIADGISCCYHFESKPMLNANKAQQQCEQFGDMWSGFKGVTTAGLATPFDARINSMLAEERSQYRLSVAEQAWVGGRIAGAENAAESADLQGVANISWSNSIFSFANGDYGAAGTSERITCDPTDQSPAGNVCRQYLLQPVEPRPNMENNPSRRNGLFYQGEPSILSKYQGQKESCLSMGTASKRIAQGDGINLWNDAKCSKKQSYFCEYCMITPTTTTFQTSTTTAEDITTTTTAEPTTTTTWTSTTTTVAPSTSTTWTSTTTVATTTTTTAEPTVTSKSTTTTEPPTTTTAEPACSTAICGADCGWPLAKDEVARCGWSSKHKACVEGGVTRGYEISMGSCTDPNSAGFVPPTPTREEVYYTCGAINCAADCTGDYTGQSGRGRVVNSSGGTGCGWSKKDGGKCLPEFTGAVTSGTELSSGLCRVDQGGAGR